MNRKQTLIYPISIGVLALLATFYSLRAVNAEGLHVKMEGSTALGSGFSYQGRLSDAGGPVTDNCDFNFGLWDAAVAGSQLGLTQTVTSTAVSDGLFSVKLNEAGQFGGSAFDGSPRWLNLGVRCPAGGGAYNGLSPRQALNPTPYAIWADSAPWSGLAGVPGGFADNVDDTGGSYANVIVVAKSGGDFTTITDALNSISGADPDNTYLIWVAPGVYTETVTMKQYVDIEGAGIEVTKITQTGSSANNTGTVLGATNAELRHLAVENTGGNTYAIAIYNNTAIPRLTHLKVAAVGATGTNIGIFNANTASSVISEVEIKASGGIASYGVWNSSSHPRMRGIRIDTFNASSTNSGIYNVFSSPTLVDIDINSWGSLSNNYGIWNTNVSSPSMRVLRVRVFSGVNNYGVLNESNSNPSMDAVFAGGVGGSSNNYGVYNNNSSPTMTGGSSKAAGGSTSYGVYNTGASPMMNNVDIQASGATTNFGIYNFNASSPIVTEGSARALGGTNSTGTYSSGGSPEFFGLISEASGASSSNKGLENINTSSLLVNVSAFAEGGTTNYGIRNSGASPTMTAVIANASGSNTANYGVRNSNSSNPVMTGVSASASGSATNQMGVYNESSSSPRMKDVNASSEGGANGYGIYNTSGASPHMENVTASSRSATGLNSGIYNNGVVSTTKMIDVTASAYGGTDARGIYNTNSSPEIIGATAEAASATSANSGIYNTNSAPKISGTSATGSNGNNNYGVRNLNNSNPEMKDVQAGARGTGSSTNRGVYNFDSSPRMTHVTANASGGSDNYGVENSNNAYPVMTAVDASAEGGSSKNFAIYNTSGVTPTLTNVTATALGSGSSSNIGVYNDGASPKIDGGAFQASGGDEAFGIYQSSGTPEINAVVASAFNANTNYGIYVNTDITMVGITALTSGTGTGYGVYVSNASVNLYNSNLLGGDFGLFTNAGGGIYTVDVYNSTITGGSRTVRNDTEFTTRVNESILSGASTLNTGTLTCTNVYDENFVFSAAACP